MTATWFTMYEISAGFIKGRMHKEEHPAKCHTNKVKQSHGIPVGITH